MLSDEARNNIRRTPERLKQYVKREEVWGFLVSIAVLLMVSLAFFSPDNFDGATLAQHDTLQGMANGQEAKVYEQQTGEKALWTNSLFSGMPTFQISPEYPSNKLFTWINSVYGLGLPAPSNLLFMMMFGFLIMLTCLRLRWWYALIGALAWGLSSYFIIIIGAGHIWKFLALTYVPPTIGALFLIYRGRLVAGAALLSLFLMMELNANHPQITYYFSFVILLLVIAFLIRAVQRKLFKKWLVSSVTALCAAVLAFGANLPSLYNTYEYSKETKRAASELTAPAAADSADATAERPTGGLPKSEIGGWSNLPEESFSLLIPNIKGGASIKPEKGANRLLTLNENEHYDYRMEASQPYVRTTDGQGGVIPVFSQLPEYFGGKGMTNGPFYVGALIVALFILGCFIVRGPVKWVLVIATALSVLMAMGNHFESLTDFLIYNVPLYNKFRAAETALVIACLCMPLLAMLGLQKLFTTPNALKDKQIQISLSVAFIFPLFVCVMAYVSPSVFGSAITPDEAAMLSSLPQQFDSAGYIYDPAQIQATVDNIENLRYSIVSADALRSMGILVLGIGAIFLFLTGKVKKWTALAAIALIVTVDLYSVDKRYVDHDSFVTASFDNKVIRPDAADTEILQDNSYYRVADIEKFTDARRSYFHHMIGGYHAAKLNRYNDLLERRLYPGLNSIYEQIVNDMLYGETPGGADWNIISMLNTKYIIVPTSENYMVYLNKQALGPAWLVDNIKYVANADLEMAALSDIDPATEAVADQRFKELLGEQAIARSQGDYIKLAEYTPNRLTYDVNTAKGGLAVFSEIWFPWGWNVTVDGKPASLGRVNYVLRALRLPPGKHTVVMTFDPQSLHTTSQIAYVSVTLIYCLCALALFLALVGYTSRKEDQNTAKS